MKTKLLPILIANLFVVGPVAYAQDAGTGFKLTGEATAGYLYNRTTSNNKAQLNEYQDLNTGIISNAEVKGRSDEYWVNFFGENFGRTDMYLNLQGGKYGIFSYRLYDDEMPHNLSFGAKSPLIGTGGDLQTTVFPQFNTSGWNQFDLGYTRKNYGGNFEFTNNSPWYVRVDANQVKSAGTKVGSAALGTSPGNGSLDLAFPVQYLTTNASAEAGYQSPQGNASINFLHSSFSNDNELLRWTNPFFGNGLDTTTLAPSNTLTKVSANGSLRQLPWNSTLSARGTYSKAASDAGILGSTLNGGANYGIGAGNAPSYTFTNPSPTGFQGNVKTATASVSLASNPTTQLDTRLWWNWSQRSNQSSEVNFTDPTAGATNPGNLFCAPASPPTAPPGPYTCSTELFGYTKNNFGGEAGFRFSRANRVVASYDYLNTDTTGRPDFDRATERKYAVEWRNTTFDWMSSRLKYQYLTRDSNFLLGTAGANPTEVNYLLRYVKAFDMADLKQNLVKLVLDLNPVPLLNFGIEAIYKNNDYDQTTLARTNDWRQEYFASVSYGDLKTFRTTLFADVEYVKYDSDHRNISQTTANAANPFPYTPNALATTSNYNWNAANHDRNWAIGIGSDWAATTRLTVKGSAIVSSTQGWADIQSQNNYGAPYPIRSFDTTHSTSLNLKGVYDWSKHWAFTLGYAFQRYRYADDQMNQYQNLVVTSSAGVPPNNVVPPGVPTSGTSTSYLNGAYANPDYTANIFYVTGTYKF